MPTPDELRQMAAELEARASELRRLADDTERALKGLPTLSIGHTMANMDTSTIPPPSPHRVGIKLVPEENGEPRPYAIAALNAGISLRQLSERLQIGYSAIKMRNLRGIGDAETRKLLAKKPYLVPASAWPEE